MTTSPESKCTTRQEAYEECARICDASAAKVREMLHRSRRRAALNIPGDIRDHDNDAAGLDGMLSGITDMASAIRAAAEGR